jgi:phenylalanyl-tRNA synthetase beta chain
VAGLATRSVGGLPADVMELKGLVEQMAGLLRTILTLEPADTEPFLQPGLQWVIRDSGGQAVGWLGRLATAAAAALDMDHPLAMVELDLGRADLLSQAVSYQPFSRFPAVKRDLSLLVPSAVTYGQLAACVEAAGGELLTQVELFDIYAGKGVPEGLSAYGIRLKFQSAKGSLKGATVDRAIAAILGALSEQLQVQQRTA